MEHRPGFQIGFGHPERPFDLKEVVVRGDDAWPVDGFLRDIRDVPLEAHDLPGAFDQCPVHTGTFAGELTNRSFLTGRLPSATFSARSICLFSVWLSRTFRFREK